MADTNFDKLAVSIKRYIDDKTKNSSSSPVDMSQYVKKRELSSVATSGSYLDLSDLPVITGGGSISKDELQKLLANNKASNTDVSNIIKDIYNVTITPGTAYSGYIDLNQLDAVMEAIKKYVGTGSSGGSSGGGIIADGSVSLIYYAPNKDDLNALNTKYNIINGNKAFVNSESSYYCYYNGKWHKDNVFVQQATPPEDTTKIWIPTTDSYTYQSKDISLSALKSTIDSIYSRMDAMQAEIDYLKEHGGGGGSTPTVNKISLGYDDDSSEKITIKGLAYVFEDDSSETESNNKITLEFDDGTTQEVGGNSGGETPKPDIPSSKDVLLLANGEPLLLFGGEEFELYNGTNTEDEPLNKNNLLLANGESVLLYDGEDLELMNNK